MPFPPRVLPPKPPPGLSRRLPCRPAGLSPPASPYRCELGSPPSRHGPRFLFWLRPATFLRRRYCGSSPSAFHFFSTSTFV